MKEMVLLCSIYNVGIRNLAEDHNIKTKENQSGKEDLVLVDPSHSVQKIKMIITSTMTCYD